MYDFLLCFVVDLCSNTATLCCLYCNASSVSCTQYSVAKHLTFSNCAAWYPPTLIKPLPNPRNPPLAPSYFTIAPLISSAFVICYHTNTVPNPAMLAAKYPPYLLFIGVVVRPIPPSTAQRCTYYRTYLSPLCGWFRC